MIYNKTVRIYIYIIQFFHIEGDYYYTISYNFCSIKIDLHLNTLLCMYQAATFFLSPTKDTNDEPNHRYQAKCGLDMIAHVKFPTYILDIALKDK